MAALQKRREERDTVKPNVDWETRSTQSAIESSIRVAQTWTAARLRYGDREEATVSRCGQTYRHEVVFLDFPVPRLVLQWSSAKALI